MKKRIKNFLKWLNVYEYLKYSTFFCLYERLCKPEVQLAARKEVNFYKSFLSSCPLIFDIGANDGHKTEAFLLIAKKVVCCEPDHKNFKTLQIRFRRRKSRVMLEKAAIGAKIERKAMFIHHDGSAFNTLNEKFKHVLEADQLQKWNEDVRFEKKIMVEQTTLSALIKKFGRPYFIKIDVEGYELEVIKGLNQRIPYMSLECLFPDFAEELQQSLLLLKNLDPEVEFNIAVHEKLIFPEFKTYQFIKEFLKYYNQTHFEMVVRMNVKEN
jgi:FkbM family methyltransferase